MTTKKKPSLFRWFRRDTKERLAQFSITVQWTEDELAHAMANHFGDVPRTRQEIRDCAVALMLFHGDPMGSSAELPWEEPDYEPEEFEARLAEARAILAKIDAAFPVPS
jgi:hypothetical protein